MLVTGFVSPGYLISQAENGDGLNLHRKCYLYIVLNKEYYLLKGKTAMYRRLVYISKFRQRPNENHGKKRCTKHIRDIKAIANKGSIKVEYPANLLPRHPLPPRLKIPARLKPREWMGLSVENVVLQRDEVTIREQQVEILERLSHPIAFHIIALV